MSFMLYEVVAKDGYQQFRYLKKPKIAGKSGPLAAIEMNRNCARLNPFAWHASANDIVSAIPGTTAGQEILIDLKPNDSEHVSLYRLKDVWGYSKDGFTPLALLLETLFVDHPAKDVKSFKKQFDDRNAKRELVGEFLYVQNWNWGRVGSVNGALLWNDAFTYLVGELRTKLR